MKKKTSFIVTTLLLALVVAFPVFATQSMTETSKNVKVEYEVGQTYTITIPADVTFGEGSLTKTSSVTASNVLIANGKKLEVTMDSANYDNGYRLVYEGSRINYSIKAGATEVADNSVVLSVDAGADGLTGTTELTFATTAENIKNATKAGTHSDALTFTVAVK